MWSQANFHIMWVVTHNKHLRSAFLEICLQLIHRLICHRALFFLLLVLPSAAVVFRAREDCCAALGFALACLPDDENITANACISQLLESLDSKWCIRMSNAALIVCEWAQISQTNVSRRSTLESSLWIAVRCSLKEVLTFTCVASARHL